MKTIQDKTNVIAPGGDFTSYGTIKDNTGSNDGTPADTDLFSDGMQFFERLIDQSGISPNGLLDSDADGFQLFEALRILTKPYKLYVALISQTSTNAPTVKILGFNEIGNIVWTRDNVGQYSGTLSSAFVVDKTHLSISSGQGGGLEQRLDRVDANTLSINAFIGGSNADSGMDDVSLEIRVYD